MNQNSLVKTYEQQANELEAVMATASADAVLWKPDVTRWSMLEIAGHLADAELLAAVRIRRIVTQDRNRLYGYKQEQWAAQLNYQKRQIERVVARFALLRRENAELLETLSDEVWQFRGEHDEDGATSLESLIVGYLAHTAKHLIQLRGLMTAFSAQTL